MTDNDAISRKHRNLVTLRSSRGGTCTKLACTWQTPNQQGPEEGKIPAVHCIRLCGGLNKSRVSKVHSTLGLFEADGILLVQPGSPCPSLMAPTGASRKKENPPSEKFWKFTTRVVSETKDEMKVPGRSARASEPTGRSISRSSPSNRRNMDARGDWASQGCTLLRHFSAQLLNSLMELRKVKCQS